MFQAIFDDDGTFPVCFSLIFGNKTAFRA